MTTPNCPCDIFVFPTPLSISAGLDALPRQIGTFADFREALLAQIQRGPQDHPVLVDWRARDRDDLGLMLLEMWAYVCDVVSFYDQVAANEAYLRTAVQRASLRKLVGLIGYLPKPALASSVRLAALVEGRVPVAIPAGTAFRSAAFGAEPPQIFETSARATGYPDANQWTVVPPRATMLGGTFSSILLQPQTARVREGKLLYLEFGAGASLERWVGTATSVTTVVESDAVRYVRVDLDPAVTLTATHPLSSVRVLVPTQRTGLWTQTLTSDDPAPKDDWSDGAAMRTDIDGTRFLLNGLHREIGAGDLLLLQIPDNVVATRVVKFDEPQVTVVAARTMTIDHTSVTVPATTAPTTRLWTDFDAGARSFHLGLVVGGSTGILRAVEPVIADDYADPTKLVIHYGVVDGGRVVANAATVLASSDTIALASVHVVPSGPPPIKTVFLASADQRGVESAASVDFVSRVVTLDATTAWSPPFELPVKVYGNVVATTRGETVPFEILGSGDATVGSQSFVLQKKPLTYVPSPSSQTQWGAESTLDLWVDGLRWAEVPSFYGVTPDAQVYIVRQRDDGASVVTFGDGVAGARLTTGISNVVATYRFGAGGAAPPALSIKQLARPVPGLRSVVQPVAAAGGADAETAESMRIKAPRTALLLGRAVSIQDFEAAASAVDGVRAASAEWRWQPERHRPMVQVRFIGDAGLAPLVTQRLRAISDPSTPIDVAIATPVGAVLTLDLHTDPRREAAAVSASARAALIAPDTGLLVPERIGIGRPVFRSRILLAALDVPGALGARALTWQGAPFLDYGETPGPGNWFDFESLGSVTVTGSPVNG